MFAQGAQLLRHRALQESGSSTMLVNGGHWLSLCPSLCSLLNGQLIHRIQLATLTFCGCRFTLSPPKMSQT